MKFISFLIGSMVLLTACSSPGGNYDGLAKCLTDQGVIMYGTSWCSHCKNQKAAFGESFNMIHYVDCEKKKIECETAGIKGFPTWIINDIQYPGEQPMDRLASLSGCTLD